MSSTRMITRCAREARRSHTSSLKPSTRSLSSSTGSICLKTALRTSTNSASTLHVAGRDSAFRLSLPARSHGLIRNASTIPGAAETYVAYGMTQKLFDACSSQADYKVPQATQKGVEVPLTESGEHLGTSDSWWYQELGLTPTFSTWSQITFLHMYLLTVRLRALPTRDSVQTYSRHLIDHFSHNAEHRMDVLHDIGSRSIRNKYLKDLFIQWRGIIAAYDEGLVKGDAVLGAAVWRNLWKASPTSPDGKDIDWTKVAWVVAYMRRVLAEISKMSEADMVMALSKASSTDSPIFGFSAVDKRMAGGN
ncbi:hypothetical protein N7495_008849 [Penicillium taxi]|uniref:uncharacterized protein n=1 Tax=Penicillium taxi TaxID=168475 RepID=UPI0025455CD1|nr:uncharacterized protein N7495_008849 [Penicillium taxi]KAJ5888808.1 hypothetical protein N7495_008849 [Penicillium taxi]